MIICPSCGATLPKSVGACQFCGKDVGVLYRAADHSREITVINHTSKTVWFAYMAIAGFWVGDGIFHLCYGLGLFGSEFSLFAIALGSVMTVIGVGFLARNRVFRSNYMAICFVALALGVWTAIDGMRAASGNLTQGYILCTLGGVRALSAGVMAGLAAKTFTKLVR